MSQRIDRKLRLRKETLRSLDRRLDSGALARVVGGSDSIGCASGFNDCASMECWENSGASLSGSVKCPDSFQC